LESLEKNGTIDVNTIAAKCNVSPITARRDLEELANRGYLLRTHGGAVRDESVTHLFSFARRLDNKNEKKQQIGKFAAQFINDNDTIFLDCGTTVFMLCRFIRKKKNLKVISNSISVVSELAKYPDIKLILIGGDILTERRATYGPTAWQQIHQYHTDKAFIGTDGLSLKNGLTSYDEYEAQIVLAMAEASDTTYLLCDSSKIEKNSVYKYASITLPDHIITDDEVTKELIQKYDEQNIHLLIA